MTEIYQAFESPPVGPATHPPTMHEKQWRPFPRYTVAHPAAVDLGPVPREVASRLNADHYTQVTAASLLCPVM